MKIITIAKHKGGLGASTLAWALASIWANSHRVLVWDMDPQQTLSAALSPGGGLTAYDVLTKSCEPLEAIASAHISYNENLKVIGGSDQLAKLDAETMGDIERLHLVQDAIHGLFSFDLLLIDTPPSEGSVLTLAPLVAANFALLPCSTDDASFQQIDRVRQTVRQIRKRLNPNLFELPLAINLYDQRLSMDRQVLAATKNKYQTFNTIVPRRTSLREEMAASEPCTNPELIALAKEILEYL